MENFPLLSFFSCAEDWFRLHLLPSTAADGDWLNGRGFPGSSTMMAGTIFCK
ncbi:hypothetical protein DEO72_LG9g1749 [Vigna unguiculata]|uniref:Uncharacterized protein n=1 Tax=Vigna unguiculata TaxID=3917 RepID=A0A4D6N3R5_VIGUN|nr:hypothetical protein DEO72_LG9g1749 [Vigna unguiculata]